MKQARLKNILWVADEIPSDSPEICVGQAMAHSSGDHMRNRLTPGFRPRSTFGYFMNFIKNDTPGLVKENIISIAANNVDRHATRLFIFKTTTKTYIWYYNPWGYDADLLYTVEASKKFEEKYKDEQWFKEIDEIKIDELNKIHKTWTIGNLITPEERVTYSTKLFLSYIKKYAMHLYSYLIFWMNKASNVSDDKNGTCGNISDEHIMSIIFLLKVFFKQDHIEVINLCNSMTSSGPQTLYSDGCRHQLTSYARNHKSNTLGSCVIWEEIYTLHAYFLLKIALKKEDDEQIMNAITNTLRHNHLLGEQHARNLLGKVVFATTPRETVKNVLLGIFNVIPEKKDILDENISLIQYYSLVKNRFDFAMARIEEHAKYKESYDREEYIEEYIEIVNTFLKEVAGGESMEDMLRYSKLVIDYTKDKFSDEEFDETGKFKKLLNFIMLMISCKHKTTRKRKRKM